jgi:hypothetical protein
MEQTYRILSQCAPDLIREAFGEDGDAPHKLPGGDRLDVDTSAPTGLCCPQSPFIRALARAAASLPRPGSHAPPVSAWPIHPGH